MTGAETLKIERRGRIAILSFNRPSVLNAFDGPLVKVHHPGDGGTLLLVLECPCDRRTWRGPRLLAGFVLKAGAATAGQRSLGDWRRVLETDFAFIMTFWECQKPTIAAIHGYCIGGAFELSLACDMPARPRPTLRLGAPEVKFGSGAVAMLLPFVTGSKAAKEILLTGDAPSYRRESFNARHRELCRAGWGGIDQSAGDRREHRRRRSDGGATVETGDQSKLRSDGHESRARSSCWRPIFSSRALAVQDAPNSTVSAANKV